MASDGAGNEVDRPISRWPLSTGWLFTVVLSAIVFLLTFNEFLAAAVPYLRTGWPPARTGIWLRFADPWRARGIVGMWFHLAMAGLSAAVAGVAALVLIAFLESRLNRPADLNYVMLVLAVIFSGCAASFVSGWIGIYTALRHGIQMYVVSNLYNYCSGDFSRIASLPMHRYVTNPVNFILAIAIFTPAIIGWCAMLLVVGSANPAEEYMVWLVAGIFTVLAIGIAGASMIFNRVSRRLIAQTPLECWTASVPDSVDNDANWYRRDEDNKDRWIGSETANVRVAHGRER